MDVGGNSYHVDDTVLLVNDIVLVVATTNIRHDGNLHIRIVFSDNRADIFLITEFPFAEFVHIEKLLRGFVTKLHDIHSRLDIGAIEGVDKLVGKHKTVHESSITNGCVQHTDIRADCH